MKYILYYARQDVIYDIKASGVLCNKKVPLASSEHESSPQANTHPPYNCRTYLRKMRMLRWMCGLSKRDMVINEVILAKVEVASTVDKRREVRLRWFVHVKRRCTDILVKRCSVRG